MTAPPVAPEVLSPIFDQIPAELRELRKWVLWRQEWRPPTGTKPGTYTKEPFQASGAHAKVTAPATWTTFDKAVEAYQSGRFTGIGFVLDGSGLVVIDLDDKDGKGTFLDAEGKPTPLLSGILSGLDSYAEVSPSGKGVHIFVRGSLPEGGRRRGDYEVYETGRYMSVTGIQIPGTPSLIAESTEALAGFHAEHIAAPKVEQKPRPAPSDRITMKPGSTGKRATPKSVTDRGVTTPDEMTDAEILETARNSTNGAKFSALWNGSTAEHGGDSSRADAALCQLIAFYVGPNPARIDSLFRLSQLWRPKWDERHSSDGRTYGQMTIDSTLEKLGDTFQPPGVEAFRKVEETVSRAVAAPDPTPGAKLSSFNLTDAGNAERLIARYGEDLRHVEALGWRVWTGNRWKADDAGLMERARDTVRALYAEAAELLKEAHEETDRDLRKQLAARAEELSRFATKSEATRSLSAMIEQVRSFPSVRLDFEAFALKPWRVPFLNGVWDRGEFREHRREDCIEHLLPVAYDPKADRREWLALLERMTGGDTDLARTLQDVAGYALSGASSYRVLPWAYGKKGTGKSTFAELLLTATGAAGGIVADSDLNGEKDRERLGSTVRGKRVLVLHEAGTKRLSAEVLKTLSGGDRITGRELYSSKRYEASPTWVLLAVSNDPPSVNAHDDALRDRVVALPFLCPLGEGEKLTFTCGRRLEEVRQDPQSPLLIGFVAWAVEGLRRVHEAQEIHLAESVKSHTRRFWSETDDLTDFWESLDAKTIEKGMSAKDLHDAYITWRENERAPGYPLRGKKFAAACRVAGLEQVRRSAGVFWYRPAPTLNVGMYETEQFPENLAGEGYIEKVAGKVSESYIPTLTDDDMEEI